MVPKKSSGFPPVINLRNQGSYVEYNHFKMENLLLLKELLEEGDYLCKLDLKDVCFSVPLHQGSQKYVKFQWKQKQFQFYYLCSVLDLSSRVFTKLMKVQIAILRRLNILLIVYLDDILLIARSQKELITARDTLIFLLQNQYCGHARG